MISWICHWNDKDILDRCLDASLKREALREDQIILLNNYPSLSSSYYDAEKNANNSLLIFAHQDIVLSQGWRSNLLQSLKIVEERDPNWALCGVFGCIMPRTLTMENGNLVDLNAGGCGKDASGPWGGRTDYPWEADVLDACLLVKRKGTPFFDPNIPTFHGAAEDICLAASALGRNKWVIGTSVDHQSQREKEMTKTLPSLRECTEYLVNKWNRDIPSTTGIYEMSSNILNK